MYQHLGVLRFSPLGNTLWILWLTYMFFLKRWGECVKLLVLMLANVRVKLVFWKQKSVGSMVAKVVVAKSRSMAEAGLTTSLLSQKKKRAKRRPSRMIYKIIKSWDTAEKPSSIQPLFIAPCTGETCQKPSWVSRLKKKLVIPEKPCLRTSTKPTTRNPRYSLQWFQKLFTIAIDTSPKAEDLEERALGVEVAVKKSCRLQRPIVEFPRSGHLEEFLHGTALSIHLPRSVWKGALQV